MSRIAIFRGRETTKPDGQNARIEIALHKRDLRAGGILSAPTTAGSLEAWLTPQAEALYSKAGFLLPDSCPTCLRFFDAYRPGEEGGWHDNNGNFEEIGEDRTARAYCSVYCRQRAGDSHRRNAKTTWNLCVVCDTGFRCLAPNGKIQERKAICPPPWDPSQAIVSPADYKESPCYAEWIRRGLRVKATGQAESRDARETEGRTALVVRAAIVRGLRPGDSRFEKAFPALSETDAYRLDDLVKRWALHTDGCPKRNGRCGLEKFRLAHRWAEFVARANAGETPGTPPVSPRRSRAEILAAQEAKRQRKTAARAKRVALNAARGAALRQAGDERSRRAAFGAKAVSLPRQHS